MHPLHKKNEIKMPEVIVRNTQTEAALHFCYVNAYLNQNIERNPI